MELSRSEQKRRIKQLEKLVKELVKLPASLLDELPAGEEVRELAGQVSGLKGGARKRQIKYITKLLRQEPVEPLYDFLARRKGNVLLQNKQFHETEYLRDALVAEAITARRRARETHQDLEENWQSSVVQDISAELPSIDRKTLTRLAFLFAMTRSRKHSREIFRLLQAARELEELNRKMNAK